MTDQHDDFGRYFLPEPGGTEQPPEKKWAERMKALEQEIRAARSSRYVPPPTIQTEPSATHWLSKGSRYAKPYDPWPDVPDAEEERRQGYAEHYRARPLLDGSDGERVKLTTDAIYQALRLADIAPHDAIRATQAIVERLQEPLDA